VFQLTASQNPLQFANTTAEKTGIWSVSIAKRQQCARLPVGEFVFVSLLDWTCKAVFLQIN
jgi:hypothetical protein